MTMLTAIDPTTGRVVREVPAATPAGSIDYSDASGIMLAILGGRQ